MSVPFLFPMLSVLLVLVFVLVEGSGHLVGSVCLLLLCGLVVGQSVVVPCLHSVGCLQLVQCVLFIGLSLE